MMSTPENRDHVIAMAIDNYQHAVRQLLAWLPELEMVTASIHPASNRIGLLATRVDKTEIFAAGPDLAELFSTLIEQVTDEREGR